MGIEVLDRIRKTSGVAYDRNRGVAQAVHLIQTAGLIARRHEKNIAARLDQMSQRFIVSGTKRHAARKKPCQSFEKRHIAWTAAPKHKKGKVPLLQQNGKCINKQIDALLFR